MKQRFNFLDIRAIVNELKDRLIGKYIQNFYSTSQRILYIKFSNKDILLIEPGIRIHLTDINGTEISHFCKILRKRAKREKVNDIYQSGFDRVIVFELNRQKIVVEFFSGGNIFILEDDKIVEVFRIVRDLEIIKGSIYVFNKVKLDFSFENFIKEEISNFLPFDELLVTNIIDQIYKRTGINILELKKDLSSKCENIQKSLEVHGLSMVNDNNIHKNVAGLTLESDRLNDGFLEAFNRYMAEFGDYIENIKGFGGVILKNKKPLNFVPFKTEVDKSFESFNDAVDFFFSDRKPSNKLNKTKFIDKELKIKLRQEQNIKELMFQAEEMDKKANIINEEKDFISKVMNVLKGTIKNKIKWEDFKKFKEEEDKKNNEISKSIIKFDFKNKMATIKVKDVFLDINFDLSVYNNITSYYNKKKKILEKIEKTKLAMDNLSLKNTSKEITKKRTRKIFWFEKFNYFFTSDGELIIAGKNSQQNEIIVKKHLNENDLYFHADVVGASSVILKKYTEVSLNETANMALCLSKCWDTKIVAPVWYVKGDQVSKTAPTGQYVTKGAFLISGNKEFLYPYKLEYGLGILFKLEDTYDVSENDNDIILFENNYFTSNPLDYEIEFAFPVSGPWCVIKNYKYKCKILPGKDKKGKIVNAIVKKFLSESDDKETRLIKSISNEEYSSVLISNLKIGKM